MAWENGGSFANVLRELIMSSLSADRREVITLLRGLLISNPWEMTVDSLQRDYKRQEGCNIPYARLGYNSLLEFLQSMPEAFTVDTSRGSPYRVTSVVTEKTAHMEALVTKQKSSKSQSRYVPPRRRQRPETACPPDDGPSSAPAKGACASPRSPPLPPADGCGNRPLPRCDFVPAMIQSLLHKLLGQHPEGVPLQTIQTEVCAKYPVEKFGIVGGAEKLVQLLPHIAKFERGLVVPVQHEVLANIDDIPRMSKPRESQRGETRSVERGKGEATGQDKPDGIAARKRNNPLIHERIVHNFQKMLDKFPDGIWCSDMPSVYRSMFGDSLQFQSLGYISMVQMASDLPAIFHLVRPNGEDWKVLDARAEIPKKYVAHCIYDPNYDKEHKHSRVPSQIKKNIRWMMEYHPNGLMEKDFLAYYEDAFLASLCLQKMGFPSLLAFLHHLRDDDVVALTTADACTWVFPVSCYPQPDTPAALPPLQPQEIGEDELQSYYPSHVMGPHDAIPNVTLPEWVKQGSMVEVYVGEIRTPHCFWVQLRGSLYFEALQKLMDDIQAYFVVHRGACIMPGVAVRLGQICACLYADDWHRVRIVGIPNSTEVQILYIDYGTRSSVRREALRFLPKEFGWLPAQAIRCGLTNIKPPRGTTGWHLAASKRFLELVTDKALVGVVASLDPQRESFTAALVDTTRAEDLHVNDTLVSEGYAEFRADAVQDASKDHKPMVEPGRQRRRGETGMCRPPMDMVLPSLRRPMGAYPLARKCVGNCRSSSSRDSSPGCDDGYGNSCSPSHVARLFSDIANPLRCAQADTDLQGLGSYPARGNPCSSVSSQPQLVSSTPGESSPTCSHNVMPVVTSCRGLCSYPARGNPCSSLTSQQQQFVSSTPRESSPTCSHDVMPVVTSCRGLCLYPARGNPCSSVRSQQQQQLVSSIPGGSSRTCSHDIVPAVTSCRGLGSYPARGNPCSSVSSQQQQFVSSTPGGSSLTCSQDFVHGLGLNLQNVPRPAGVPFPVSNEGTSTRDGDDVAESRAIPHCKCHLSHRLAATPPHIASLSNPVMFAETSLTTSYSHVNSGMTSSTLGIPPLDTLAVQQQQQQQLLLYLEQLKQQQQMLLMLNLPGMTSVMTAGAGPSSVQGMLKTSHLLASSLADACFPVQNLHPPGLTPMQNSSPGVVPAPAISEARGGVMAGRQMTGLPATMPFSGWAGANTPAGRANPGDGKDARVGVANPVPHLDVVVNLHERDGESQSTTSAGSMYSSSTSASLRYPVSDDAIFRSDEESETQDTDLTEEDLRGLQRSSWIKPIAIAGRRIYLIYLRKRPFLLLDEFVPLFTGFCGRHIVVKILESRKIQLPFTEVSRGQQPDLFTLLDNSDTQFLNRSPQDSTIRGHLLVVPLSLTLHLLDILNVDDAVIHDALQQAINCYCSQRSYRSRWRMTCDMGASHAVISSCKKRKGERERARTP